MTFSSPHVATGLGGNAFVGAGRNLGAWPDSIRNSRTTRYSVQRRLPTNTGSVTTTLPLLAPITIPSYYNHPWYHGYWNHHWGYPGYGWGYGVGFGLGYGVGFGLSAGYPLGWGYGGWGLGSPYYMSGYMPYTNPYWTGVGVATTIRSPSRWPLPVRRRPRRRRPMRSMPRWPASRRAIMPTRCRWSIRRLPNSRPTRRCMNSAALALFALGNYAEAASTIHSVLAIGPGWDWTTMSGLYPGPDPYTAQLRALERYVELNPRKADGQFLLAYHYMTGR